jgi:hypothetical protein
MDFWFEIHIKGELVPKTEVLEQPQVYKIFPMFPILEKCIDTIGYTP